MVRKKVGGNILGQNRHGHFISRPFEKGNTLSLAENMTEDANRRRVQGWMRSLAAQERIRRGDKIVTKTSIRAEGKRARARLRENLQAEARDIQNLARTLAVEAMERVAEVVMNSDKGSDVIAGAALLFERAYGKATQTSINANIDANGKPTEVTSKELDTRIAEALKRVEIITGGAPKEEAGEGGAVDVCESDRDSGNSSVH